MKNNQILLAIAIVCIIIASVFIYDRCESYKSEEYLRNKRIEDCQKNAFYTRFDEHDAWLKLRKFKENNN